jgi:hypothetical protein
MIRQSPELKKKTHPASAPRKSPLGLGSMLKAGKPSIPSIPSTQLAELSS